jgi:hypothetical protein
MHDVTKIALIVRVGAFPRNVERVDRGLPIPPAKDRNDVAAATSIV